MKASDLVDLLAAKHSKDVFVPECKNGPSLTGDGHRRMDAWAMRRSWSNPRVTAYEVKVARSDFLADDKWHDYLDCCNELYFVCPQGLISPEECPYDAGLMWASKNGTRLFVKKKAPVRLGAIRESVFRYILMSRVAIKRESYYSEEYRQEYWRKWLDDKKLDLEFGRRVSRAIAALVAEEIDKVRAENVRLEKQIASLAYLRDRLAELGFNPSNAIPEWSIDRKLDHVREQVPPEVAAAVRDLLRQLPDFAKKIGVETV